MTAQLLEAQRLNAFKRWTRENFDRNPTRAEIARFLKGVK